MKKNYLYAAAACFISVVGMSNLASGYSAPCGLLLAHIKALKNAPIRVFPLSITLRTAGDVTFNYNLDHWSLDHLTSLQRAEVLIDGKASLTEDSPQHGICKFSIPTNDARTHFVFNTQFSFSQVIAHAAHAIQRPGRWS